jgi:hypothetical protein
MNGGGAGMFMAAWTTLIGAMFLFFVCYVILKNVFLASWEIGMLLLRKNKKEQKKEPDIPAAPPERLRKHL